MLLRTLPNTLLVELFVLLFQPLESSGNLNLLILQQLLQKDPAIKKKQKDSFDQKHGVQELPKLSPEDFVWIKDEQKGSTVVQQAAPNSYVV